MSIHSWTVRAGAQCLSCRSGFISVVRMGHGDLSQLARPFYSASSLQLPRRRQMGSDGVGKRLPAFESDVQVEDALSGYKPPTKESKQAKPKFLVEEEEACSRLESTTPLTGPESEDTQQEIRSVEADSTVHSPPGVELTEETAELSAESLSEDGVPWYLQAETSGPPTPEINPLLERQRIPDIPSDAPPVLQPLLDHVSVTLGLDSLSLIDLRHLDPPAALGANLLMVVGTARSEKHLHVSADRLCRWLRSEHKLRPYADGLLGRNELKLKMKRKNRRSKTLAAAGLQGWNGPDGLEKEVDDGIRTGWVCVHMGRVEPAPTTTEPEQQDGQAEEPAAPAFIGFGDTEDRVTIVVQMFTGQKRDETDLEGLWTEISERGVRKLQHRRNLDIEAERILDQGLPEPSVAQLYNPGAASDSLSPSRMQAHAS